MRARVKVRFGDPIDLSPYYGQERNSEVVRKLLVQCVKAIADLAGQPDFEPKLAGRKWRPDETETVPETDAASSHEE